MVVRTRFQTGAFFSTLTERAYKLMVNCRSPKAIFQVRVLVGPPDTKTAPAYCFCLQVGAGGILLTSGEQSRGGVEST